MNNVDTARAAGLRLSTLNRLCDRLSGRPGFGSAAIERGAAVRAFEATTGRVVAEPRRGLWLRQEDIERRRTP